MAIGKHRGEARLRVRAGLFMESRVRLEHLQRAHPGGTLHVEPEAQVTHADTGREWTLGCHRGDIAVPLGGGVDVQEFPITTFEHTDSKICGCQRVSVDGPAWCCGVRADQDCGRHTALKGAAHCVGLSSSRSHRRSSGRAGRPPPTGRRPS